MRLFFAVMAAILLASCAKMTGPDGTSVHSLAFFHNPEIVTSIDAQTGAIETRVLMNRRVQEDVVSPLVGATLPTYEQLLALYAAQARGAVIPPETPQPLESRGPP